MCSPGSSSSLVPPNGRCPIPADLLPEAVTCHSGYSAPGAITQPLPPDFHVLDSVARPLLQPSADALESGIKAKVENKHQYEEYLEDLKGLREELGVNLKEDLYPEGHDSPYHNP